MAYFKKNFFLGHLQMKDSENATKYTVLHQHEQHNGILVYNGILECSFLSVPALKQINEHQLRVLLIKGKIY